ncbi:alkaline phosphatase family protein [Aerococcus viridans]|uniref:Alkaline phosphatase family protein n=1 Tax=Aerococcus viridans TaxID=1377 RepID=A0A2J9PPA7_9LACT|nr:ectonucleotide pyrophosphatase/phosphodiesterase [Aerococcus viridans]MCT1798017.1 ectonucleotide pyrophosphatase/phosphodiesterase [Aerococcus viridans]PNL92189.1 alkaline phosphatase family protein [Aerococcus viridans]
MPSKKLVIVSLDAFGTEDLAYALTLPNFKKFRQEAALVEAVESVYPSLTYMCHTSIVTGQYPKDHGIINNTLLQPNRISPDWHWYTKYIKTPTLFDIASENDLSVSTILWPVTGKSRSIDYNIAEIFANRKWLSQVAVSLLASSPKYLIEKNHKFGYLRSGIKQPELDDFVTAVAVDTIMNEQPDVMAIHLVDLDSTRHGFGVKSPESKAAIERMDAHLGQLFHAIETTPAYKEAHIVLLGDHYQIDTQVVIRPNHLFIEAGLIQTKAQNKIQDYKVYAKGADGSCYIYVKDHNPLTMAQLKELLAPLKPYIETIYNREEAAALGADPECFALIEASEDYYFESDIERPIIEDTNKHIPGIKLLKASHGYSPKKENYTTMFMAKGPKIKAGVTLASGRLVDEGPTMLAMLDLAFKTPVEGKVLGQIFK